MIVRRFKTNMVPGGKTEVVNISQYDFGDVLEFELYSSEGTFVVESGTTATIRGSKPDGNGISLTADLESTQDASTGLYTYLVTVEVIQQMTAVAGKSTYEISLQKNGQEINTANFVIDVERAPLDADTLPSESVIKELVDVIDKADEIMQAAEDVEAALNTIDPTLSIEGRAADAKKVGDEITGIKQDLSELVETVNTIEPLSEVAKAALLNCFAHVAWIDEHGQAYYDALEAALNDIQSISAVYTQSGTVYATDTLDSLKENLVVTATKPDSTQYVVPDSKYTLSGVLMVGVSTITVTYKGQTATFNVNVTDSRLVYEIPANTNLANVTHDTGVTVFGKDDNYTFLIKANFDTTDKNGQALNHGGFSTGTIRLGYDISNDIIHFVTNVMYSDYYADYYTPGDISALAPHELIWVVRMNSRNVRKALYVDGEKLLDKTENVSSYMNDKTFTGNYFAGAQVASGTNSFSGTSKVFRIYNTALDISEINAILDIELE
jgi:hypothetical protein